MTISISSRPSSAFARWSRSFSQSSFRPIARTELTTFDSSTKTSTLRVRIGLACIGHKSLEICDRCRLWQRNSPATPEYSAAFWRGEFKNSLFRFLYFNKYCRSETANDLQPPNHAKAWHSPGNFHRHCELTRKPKSPLPVESGH